MNNVPALLCAFEAAIEQRDVASAAETTARITRELDAMIERAADTSEPEGSGHG